MKACVLEKPVQLNIRDVNVPELSDDEVLVKVHASGICGSDIPRAYNNGAYSYPLIMGHEFAGEIVDIADNLYSSGKKLIGKRVGVFPLIPCMSCPMCKTEKFEMCEKYGYIGSRQDGAFAEYVKVPEWNLIELPDNVSYKQAAMLEPLSVAIHAARRAGLICTDNKNKKFDLSKSIAIIGLGTIGLLLAMVLVNAGYDNIYVIGNKDLQRLKAIESGVSKKNYFDKIMPYINVDVFFECVGSEGCINTAIDNTRANGTVVFVGNPASDISINKNVYWKILRKQLTIIGTWNSSFTHLKDDDWHYAVNELSAKNLHPEMLITHEYCIDNITDGFDLMREKKAEYIKVMAVAHIQ